MRVALLMLLALLLACPGARLVDDDEDDDDSAESDDDDDSADDDDDSGSDDDDSTPEPECEEGATSCLAQFFRTCTGGVWVNQEECAGDTPVCDGLLGCLSCAPGLSLCDGNTVVSCGADGFATDFVEDCGDASLCIGGACASRCQIAANQYSYLGCDFVAVTNPNNVLTQSFSDDFGLVLGAPADGPDATVTIEQGGTLLSTVSVGAGTVLEVELDMIQELVWPTGSALVTQGAYLVNSDVPITAYQFEPLHFSEGAEPSHTNDASLLLPEHALGDDYMLTSRALQTIGGFNPGAYWNGFRPGFFTVAATTDGTTVQVTPSVDTLGGSTSQMLGGTTTVFTLNRGDVLSVGGDMPLVPSNDVGWCAAQGYQYTDNNYGYCQDPAADLTGTVVTSTSPVAVFNGHVCAFVPFDSFACDHLEEMALPTATWGTQVAMTAPAHPGGTGVAPAVYRVLALADSTGVSFDPAVASSTTLDSGGWVEFTTDQDFVIQGTGPLLATQFLLGQEVLGTSIGDPAMGTGIPWSQGRQVYDFLTPTTFTSHWVNLVAPAGASIVLDGSTVGGWTPIGGSGLSGARVSLGAGSHHAESTDGSSFTVTTYGYASWTSYLFPGGLNLGR